MRNMLLVILAIGILLGLTVQGAIKNDEKQFQNFINEDLKDLSVSSLPGKTKGKRAAFEQGKIIFSAGYGFPNWSQLLFRLYESYAGFDAYGFGPLHFRGEYGLSDIIGLGASVNYVGSGITYNESYYNYNTNQNQYYDYRLDYMSISFLVRMNIHFAVTEMLDPYWGLGVGYRHANYTWSTSDPNFTDQSFGGYIPVGFETTLGLRIFFMENIGAYLELGLAKSLINAGIVVGL